MRPFLASLAVLLFACSSSTTQAPADGGVSGDGAATCDPAKCFAGNKCLSDGKTVACRFVCDSHAKCPVGYFCSVNEAAEEPFCAPLTKPIEKKEKGQWGFACQGKVEAPECDLAQGFKCWARNPADASAFCTTFDCAKDSDCPGGYFCKTVNTTPNAEAWTTDGAGRWIRTIGETVNVCAPRDYCAPCARDFECAPGLRCVQDANGAGLCAPTCENETNCSADAACENRDGTNVCVPRAGVCKGDGSFCSPCMSDKDCAAGALCTEGNITRERFCTKPCKSSTECPKPSSETNWRASACSGEDQSASPKDQCEAYVTAGKSDGEPLPTPGCWSRNR